MYVNRSAQTNTHQVFNACLYINCILTLHKTTVHEFMCNTVFTYVHASGPGVRGQKTETTVIGSVQELPKFRLQPFPPLKRIAHPCPALQSVLQDSSFSPGPMTGNTSLLGLIEMQPLLAYHSRLPSEVDLWQDPRCGRTLGPYFLLLTQTGCVYILCQFT